MTDTVIHLVGHVGTDVDYRRVGSGTDLSTFRIASTPRRWDRGQGAYVDGTTTWLSVQCWRALAVNVRDSVRRGDPLMVIGKLKTEEWTKDEIRHSRFILDAIAVGHDLNRGVSTFRKVARPAEASSEDHRDAFDASQGRGYAAAVPEHDVEGLQVAGGEGEGRSSAA